jgi:hypothetical protein
MQNPGNKQCCRNSFFHRNVQILQTRSLQDSLRERHFQLYSSKVFVHGQNSSYNRILECASDYASPLSISDMSKTPSPLTQQLQHGIGSYQQFRQENFPSLPPSRSCLFFNLPHPILRFPVSLLVPILFNTSTKRDF